MRTHEKIKKDRVYPGRNGEKLRTKETVNTTVDKELKELIESTKAVHGKTFGEILEMGMRIVLINLNQAPIIDQEIARKGAEINRLVMEQSELTVLKEKIKDLKVKVLVDEGNNGNTSELIKLREVLFEKSKESIIKLWNKGDINWDSVIPRYKFQDKKEAQDWFKEKIEGMKKT